MRSKPSTAEVGAAPGSQTLLRGLAILDAVAGGARDLAALSAALGTTRSTTHRLAAALVEQRYLTFAPREGYALGPKLVELGFRAQQAAPVTRVARPHLERLSAECGDTIHLGVLEGDWALYLDKLPGRRRIEISSRVGERQPVWSTGLGKALILDLDEARWRSFHRLGAARGGHSPDLETLSLETWLARMRTYAARGIAYDREENEPEVRCVAGPIRDASGAIVAAFSVTSTVQYMDEARMEALAGTVRAVAGAISRDLGWAG
ncbi:transcriptional regulator, IclR family [Methylobacterium sp. 174MFSha1.1]|uniref:IclR family transcriptional regulator n=1 Tax=Methylobacterium sp. 174MFSha1.1 TaxID=1502749 RepID=UPI0008E57657|nr:IclR family transcriptional regulator [Methylobacterium sp. 174MFSha1.1]SFU88200.1 transcriptional regulator, IclR family [Methylobacterium sp. 174MFSha1.1]